MAEAGTLVLVRGCLPLVRIRGREGKMDIVSVINYKGGVGKTTTTANIAAQLAWKGKDVLLVDLDPQASLTFSLVSPDHWEEHLEETRTIKRWFDSANVGDEVDMNDLLVEDMRI